MKTAQQIHSRAIESASHLSLLYRILANFTSVFI